MPLPDNDATSASYRDACCNDDDADADFCDTSAPVEGKPTAMKTVNCCSTGACEDEVEDDEKGKEAKTPTDGAPECCRGKVSPCCDTSCLDRLAIRECADSAHPKACT